MRDALIVGISMVFIILVSGCTIPGLGGSKVNTDAFVGGSEGIDVSFVGNNPPARVFQNRNFKSINATLF